MLPRCSSRLRASRRIRCAWIATLLTVVAVPVTVAPSDARAAKDASKAYALGWTPLGSIRLTKDGCAPGKCALTLHPTRRYRAFGLGLDTPSPVGLMGQVTTTCADGTALSFLLVTAGGSGLFQI